MSTELLAPAGSLETLKAVIRAGADAVYIGGSRFGARAYADNPSEEELIEGLDYAHLRGKKVYLTINTLLKEEELSDLYDYVLPYYQHGLDAILVQDFGVLRYLHRQFPDLELHASTQMTVTGAYSAEDLKSYGVTRVVPARELSLPELTEIKEKTGLEVEVFIHGALCVCYSGQCLYSSMIGGRSGNRGRCAQPCRLLYLKDDKTGFSGKKESILDRKEARHFLSPKDLNGIDSIGELVNAKMDSLKIEGRMKRPEYAAGVVSIYRKYLDLALQNKAAKVSRADHQRLYDLYNRTGFTDGYLHRYNGPEMMAMVKHELTNAETQARHDLYEEIHDKYIAKKWKLPVDMQVSIYAGQPIGLLLTSGETTVYVTGEEADFAKNRPLSRDQILEKMTKIGETDFMLQEISVETDDASFVPVRALNELRRLGIEELRAALLAPYQRAALQMTKETCERTVPDTQEPILSALVSNEEQLAASLLAEEVGEIYIESFLLHQQQGSVIDAAGEYIRRCQAHHKKCSIALPFIDRLKSHEEPLRKNARLLQKMGLHTYLVRSYEMMASFLDANLSDMLRADAGIYTYNHGAKEFLREHGIFKDTAPVELNKKELYRRDHRGSEMIVYGRLPLMVTAQCLVKNTNRCNHQNECHVLTDRMGVRFPTRCICPYCYNMIYNSVPLSLLKELAALKEQGFSQFRLQFTFETAEEVRAVIEGAGAYLQNKNSRFALADGAYTKGHYLRGIE